MKKRPLTCSESKKASIAVAIEPRAMRNGWGKRRKGAFSEERKRSLVIVNIVGSSDNHLR